MLNLGLILLLMLCNIRTIHANDVNTTRSKLEDYQKTSEISKIIIAQDKNLIIASNRSNMLKPINPENPSKTLVNSLTLGQNISKNKTILSRKERDVNANNFDSNHKEFSLGINSFKNYLIEESIDVFRQQNALEFYDLLEKHPAIRNLNSALNLVNEFENLENQFFTLKKTIDFYPFYQSLLNRINEYSKNPKPGENTHQHIKLYGYLYTATLSKMHLIKNNFEPNLITDITSYLKVVSDKFNDLSQLQSHFNKVETINRHNAEFKKRFENKIEEANQFISTHITPEIDNVNQLLGEQIEMLLNETKFMQKTAKNEREKAIVRENELANAIVLRGVFRVFNVFSLILGFLGPIGKAAGSVVDGVTSVTESFVLDDNPEVNQLTELPAAVTATVTSIWAQMKSAKDFKISNFKLKIDEITKEINTLGEESIGSMDDFANIRARADALRKQSAYDGSEFAGLEEELKTALKKKEAELKASITVTDEKFVKNMKIMDRVNTIAACIITTSVHIYNNFKNDNEKLEAAGAAVKKAEENLKKLEKYEEDIYKVIAPMVKNMEKGLDEVASKLQNKSSLVLDINKWQVQSTLRDVKLKLRKMTKDFQVEDYLMRSIEKLEEAMTTLINVYDRIQNYEEQKHLADYLSAINSAGSRDIQIKDAALNAAAQKLEISIKSNVVLNQYELAIDALEQWLFPFAQLCLGEFQLPQHLFSSRTKLEDVISVAGERIKNVESRIREYKAGTFRQDKYIFKGEFNSGHISSEPFFTWRNERFRAEIDGLLSGKEISLKAEVRNSDKDKDAIKFNSLHFLFKAKNASKQLDLDVKLKGFKISAIHTGNSYYRFKDEIYVFNSESQSLVYSFEKHVANGEPLHRNMVYEKIKSGDLMLSPYTVWTLKLDKAAERSSFADLMRFKNDISIELVGSGSYVKSMDMNMNMKVLIIIIIVVHVCCSTFF